MCDSIADCPYSIDEDDLWCRNISQHKCERKLSRNNQTTNMPDYLITDGIEDCMDGSDEEEGEGVCDWKRASIQT